MTKIWAYNKYEVKQKSYIKHDCDTFADIELIIEYPTDAESTFNYLPAMHAITGWDQRFHFYKAIRIVLQKVLQNMKKQMESCELISS